MHSTVSLEIPLILVRQRSLKVSWAKESFIPHPTLQSNQQSVDQSHSPLVFVVVVAIFVKKDVYQQVSFRS